MLVEGQDEVNRLGLLRGAVRQAKRIQEPRALEVVVAVRVQAVGKLSVQVGDEVLGDHR